MRIVIDLPFPVSLNKLWRSNRGRVHRSKEYTDWIKRADALWLTQKRNAPKEPIVRFNAEISLVPPDNRRRDGDNLAKAALDFLKRIEVIADDSGAVKTTIEMLPPGEPSCRVSIESR